MYTVNRGERSTHLSADELVQII